MSQPQRHTKGRLFRMTAPSLSRDDTPLAPVGEPVHSPPSGCSGEPVHSLPLPSRTEFGFDHYGYLDGERMRVGATRTLRPADGESGVAFRQRVDLLALQLLSCGTIELDEEIRSGVVVQATLRLRTPPEPVPVGSDLRRAGGRPVGPRGRRGGV